MSTELEVTSTAPGGTGTGLAVPNGGHRVSSAFPARWASRIGRLARAHPALVAVFALYALSAFVVPTMAPALVGDDWIFVRAVEALRRDGDLEIPSLSAPTAVFQVVWGALFATLLGDHFGVLRLSTVVLVFGGGWALYGLCRDLAIDRTRSALATALYLFNPLSFVLGFTFMTDAPFTALMIVATAGYVRGLRPDRPATRATLLGAAAAALAFLVRPHGALIPLGIATYLLLARRLRPNLGGLRLLATVAAIPAAATILYFVVVARGVPSGQESFVRSIARAGGTDSWRLVQRMTFFEIMYAGAFVLPVALAAVAGLRGLLRAIPTAGWVLFALFEGIFVVALVNYGEAGLRMPYVQQFVGRWGLGPTDLNGLDRVPHLFGTRAATWLTGVCAASVLLLVLALCRQVGAPRSPHRAGAGLVLSVGLWQVVGVLPPTFPFRDWIGSLDRYLLPLLPVAICLALWALRDVRLALPVAWVGVAAFAVVSVAGTRDFLVFQRATWDVARAAACGGVPLTKLDGGYSWVGYHLWGKAESDPEPAPPFQGQWWNWYWTPGNVPATDTSYVVSAAPLEGYDIVSTSPYSAWLRSGRTDLHLLHRHGSRTYALPSGTCVADLGSETG